LPIRFTGGRAMAGPTECTAFHASRYKWVKKRIQRTETVASDPADLIDTRLADWHHAAPADRYARAG
jgi:hypothetical protein